ncbi:MAG: hypothetical protein IKH57_04670 [Clostridia bacterium]|nr:hypothetical protein [Clostridia bacterium]
MQRLDDAVKSGELPLHQMKSIVEMSKLVLRNIAKKYEKVKEGVDAIMGGRVLEYESKMIYNEGHTEGVLETLISLIKKGRLTVKEGAEEAGMTVEEFEKKTGLKAALS